MSERAYSANSQYRYGFNGKEKDDEVSGSGNQYDYGFRIYNPRLGKFLSVDPLTSSYPFYTPYQFAGNKPIAAIDLDGLEEYLVINYLNKKGEVESSMIRMVKDKQGNIVNRNYTSKDGVNHSKAKVHTVNVGADKKMVSESFSDSFTKEQEAAIKNMKSYHLKKFENQGGEEFKDVDVYEANVGLPPPPKPELPSYSPKGEIPFYGSHVHTENAKEGITAKDGIETSFFDFVSEEAAVRPVLITGSEEFRKDLTKKLIDSGVPAKNILTMKNLSASDKKKFESNAGSNGFYYIKQEKKK